MVEPGFVQLYARDFMALATRAEAGVEVAAQVDKRILEARSHAALMDARKGEGHLPAVIDRLRVESERGDVRLMRAGEDVDGAVQRRRAFLLEVAERLELTPVAPAGRAVAGRA
ncbi:MAG: hypothetical protein ACK4RV_06140 [Caulobacter sp.]